VPPDFLCGTAYYFKAWRTLSLFQGLVAQLMSELSNEYLEEGGKVGGMGSSNDYQL
jgi:hypothetical protein